MFTKFKKASELFGAIFSTNPGISTEEKANLEAAITADVDALKAEEMAVLQGELTQAKEEFGSAQRALTAKDAEIVALLGRVTESEPKAAELAILKPEFETIKAQLETYKAKVAGTKPNEPRHVSGGVTREDEQDDTKAEELERLKAEYPYSYKD